MVLADARSPALLALARLAMVLANARPPAPLAFAPLTLVRADTAWLVLHGDPCRIGISVLPPLAGTAASWLCRLSALLTGACRRIGTMRICAHRSTAPPWVGSRSPDGWDQILRWAGGWACASHPGVLGSIPKREEPGETGTPCVKVPGSSRVPSTQASARRLS
jgi:hypothetical protein